ERSVAFPLPTPCPHRITLPGGFDFDDLGAEVPQELPAEGPGEERAELNDSQVGERTILEGGIGHRARHRARLRFVYNLSLREVKCPRNLPDTASQCIQP